MHQQGGQQDQGLQNSNQMPDHMHHGGLELLATHETLGEITGTLEHYMMYDQHIQDQELLTISQRQRTFLAQMYNTIIDTMKTGRDPAVPTQTYQMEQSNDVVYGVQPSTPKSPKMSVNEINDECVSSFMLGHLKALSSALMKTALEATNPVSRRVLADSIPNVIEMGYELFLYQNKKQYYQVPQLKQEDMEWYMNSFSPVQNNLSH